MYTDCSMQINQTTPVRLMSHLVRSCRTRKKGSPYSVAERRVPELIPVLGSQPVGDVSHKPGGIILGPFFPDTV